MELSLPPPGGRRLSQLGLASGLAADQAAPRRSRTALLAVALSSQADSSLWPNLGDLVSAAMSALADKTIIMPSTAAEAFQAVKVSLGYTVGRELSRVDIEMPPGIRFGFQGVVDDLLPVPEAELSAERLAWSDRELAALVLTFFAEPPDLCVAFRTGSLVKSAKEAWEEWGESHVLSMSGKKATSKGMASGLRDQAQPVVDPAKQFLAAVRERGCKIVVVVAPRTEQLRMLRDIDGELGSGVKVILVNARLRGPQPEVTTEEVALRRRMLSGYNTVYHMGFAGANGEGIVYRATQEGLYKQRMVSLTPWMLARRKLPSLEAVEVSRHSGEPSGFDVAQAFPRSGAR